MIRLRPSLAHEDLGAHLAQKLNGFVGLNVVEDKAALFLASPRLLIARALAAMVVDLSRSGSMN